MTDLVIQIQPRRASGLDVATVCSLCEDLAATETSVKRFEVNEGDDDGPYVNLVFVTDMPHALWDLLRLRLYGDSALGALMSNASIATCQGDEGWEDYLLLHHFESAEQLDKL